ncbi:MAG: family 20 glycosylhydrolase, partial [Anaerolineae bacterium]|nr:family 20 glycosylhydrolase [Anaerolineae bacterium]
HLDIVKLAKLPRKENFILLFGNTKAAEAYLGEAWSWKEELQKKGEQAYILEITPKRVVAGGEGSLALFYASQTLRLLTRSERSRWPACQVLDWPSLPYRGLMLDISRGKVPTIETLKLLIDQLSLYKINVLQLYTEHTFVFPHHPRIGQGCGSLSSEDILILDAYARKRHIELMPNLQSFGHFAHILSLPEYAPLAESEAGWSLCPTDERTYQLLDEMYADFLPAFSSANFNVDCDETWDLGKGRSAEAAAKVGVGRLYLQHILRLRELAMQYGRRIQIWGDILLHHPELVPELPQDITLLDWHYEASEDYPSVRTFAQSGRTFWVCPGTSSWNTLFPRIENSNENIRTLVRIGAENGAVGMLNTDWGDRGHYQPIGQCWYGYIFGAEQGWTGGTTQDTAFDTRFGPLFFGESGEKVVTAMRKLAKVCTLSGMPRSNGSNTVFAFFDDPLSSPYIDQVPGKSIQEMERLASEAEKLLREALETSRDPISIEEMIFSARLIVHLARRLRASQEIRANLDRLQQGEAQAQAAQLLREAITTLRKLDTEVVRFIDEFRTLWLRRARYAEMNISLGHFERLRERFAKAQSWLQKLLEQAEAGQKPNYELDAYQEEAGEFEPLRPEIWYRLRQVGAV